MFPSKSLTKSIMMIANDYKEKMVCLSLSYNAFLHARLFFSVYLDRIVVTTNSEFFFLFSYNIDRQPAKRNQVDISKDT